MRELEVPSLLLDTPVEKPLTRCARLTEGQALAWN